MATGTALIISSNRCEAAEHNRVQPIRRQHLRLDVIERRGALDRLIRGELAHGPGDRRHQRIRIRPRVHEQPAAGGDRLRGPLAGACALLGLEL